MKTSYFLAVFYVLLNVSLARAAQESADINPLYSSAIKCVSDYDGRIAALECARVLTNWKTNNYMPLADIEAHIQKLQQQRERRIAYLQQTTQEQTKAVIQKLLPKQATAAVVSFHFDDAQAFYDQVCGPGYIDALAKDSQEQKIIRRFWIAMICRCFLAVPIAAHGHEVAYRRFINARLIYRPNPMNDIGRIDMPFAALSNPLNETFDLSQCGDTGKYLKISTGYRTPKDPKAAQVEIWIVPKFWIEHAQCEGRKKTAHLTPLLLDWNADVAPIGLFWNWGEDPIKNVWHVTNQACEEISGQTLSQLYLCNIRGPYVSKYALCGAGAGSEHFTICI